MLKRLELVGFKSFSQKTILDFPSGITVIVGPNGSGKSNIVDSLRWLLGEREAKNLRGDKVEQLIFTGTSRKGRLGLAQAAVYLDNGNRALPLEFAEVVVARKIYRDGTSEFFINKSLVRLKDVVDLFAQSKLGTKGLCIINQGNSDLFVRAAPLERQEMMEEILGLRQYQLKKHEAELKLKSTQQNLGTAKVTVEELLPHLRLLRRQAGRWEKRTVLTSQLKELENGYFAGKLKELAGASSKIDPESQRLSQQLFQKKDELQRLSKIVQQSEKQKPLLIKSSEKKSQLQRQLGNLEAQLKFLVPMSEEKIDTGRAVELVQILKKEISQLCQIIEKLTSGQIKERLRNLEKQIDSLFAKKSDLAVPKRAAILQSVQKIEAEIKLIEEAEREQQVCLENSHRDFRQAVEAVSAKKEEIQQLESKKNQLLLVKDRWHYQSNDLLDKIRQASRRPEEFDLKLAAAGFDFEQADRRLMRLRGELAALGEIDEAIIKEAGQAEERYQFLFSQISDLEKAVVDLNSLINSLSLKINSEFNQALKLASVSFDRYFKIIFGEGRARLLANEPGIGIDLSLPTKGVRSLAALSGGERSLVAIAALFALISISRPPFLIFDEVDAALDENNSRRFVGLVKDFSSKIQFVIVTHNRAVMEAADVLYGVTMGADGVSQILSLKLT
jgi:chromosome segregation protein